MVLPVFAVIVTGWLAGGLGYISRSLADGLVHFAYNVAMPALLFVTIAQETARNLLEWRFLLAFGGGSMLCFALVFLLVRADGGRDLATSTIYGMTASHLMYDVIPNQWVEIDRPDILIVEGLNALQTGSPPKDDKAIPYVSDFFDFSIYLDAAEDVLLTWYVNRFLALRNTAFRDLKSYFHSYATLSDQDAVETATSIWTRINLRNLHENILPTRQRAHLILKKGENHRVEQVSLRRL
jgi:type I pantothenate kinase